MAIKADSKRRAVINKLLPDYISLIRLALSILMLILACSLKPSKAVSVVLLLLVMLIAGAGVLLNAVKALRKGDWFNDNCLFTVSAVAVFCTGCFKEACLFAIITLVYSMAMDIAASRAKDSALSLVASDNKELRKKLREELSSPDRVSYAQKDKLNRLSRLSAMILSAVALLYAVLLPLVSDMSYLMSIRRGAMILASAAPLSLLFSFPICEIICRCCALEFGIRANNGEDIYKLSKVDTVVFDKTDVLTGGVPKLSAVSSSVLDKLSFLTIAAHIAAKSDQAIAESILSAFDGEIDLTRISDFEDHFGMGMEAKISGRPALLGTPELFELRGLAIDDDNSHAGYTLYMSISDRFAGAILFNEDINPYASEAITELKEMGINSILVSEDGLELSKKTADTLGIQTYYPLCDTLKKLSLLGEIKHELDEDAQLMYISAEDIEYHSDADIDVAVGKSSESGDISMDNIGIFGLPALIRAAQSSQSVQTQNLVISLGVKLACIALASFGLSTLWFIAVLYFSGEIFALLNTLTIMDN